MVSKNDVDFVKPKFLSAEWNDRFVYAVKEYGSSPIGLAHTKLVLTGFVVFGLLVGGVQMMITSNLIIGAVLVAFGFIQLIDFNSLRKHYIILQKNNDFIQQARLSK